MRKIYIKILIITTLTNFSLANQIDLNAQNKNQDQLKIIKVKITDNKNQNLEASIVNLGSAAQKIDADKIKLVGSMVENDNSQFKQAEKKINWNAIRLNEQTIYLDKAFESYPVFANNNELKLDDKLNAKGNPQSIIDAIMKLKHEKPNSIKDKENSVNRVGYSSSGGGSLVGGGAMGSGSAKELPKFEPKFEDKKKKTAEIGVTTDGCNVRIDEHQMAAIQQVRVTSNGQPQGECSDTLTRYILIKDYSQCSIGIDDNQEYAYRQFKLYYKAGESEAKYVSDCKPDISEKYKIQLTTQGCQPKQDEDRVIVFKRKLADIRGELKEITKCAPDESASVISELCHERKYEPDFTNQISIINKRYYYLDNEEKKYLFNGICQQSNEFLTHKYNPEGCRINYDDQKLWSTINAKIYVENGEEKHYITNDCIEIGRQPYVESGFKWKLIHSSIDPVRINNMELKYNPITRHTSCASTTFPNSSQSYYSKVDLDTIYMLSHCIASFPFILEDMGHQKIAGHYWNNLRSTIDKNFRIPNLNTSKFNLDAGKINLKFPAKEYCYMGTRETPWSTEKGQLIDHENSDEQPYWNVNIDSNYNNKKSWTYKLWCSEPKCNVTKFLSYPSYERADGSLYINESIDTKIEKIICGNGSKLEDVLK